LSFFAASALFCVFLPFYLLPVLRIPLSAVFSVGLCLFPAGLLPLRVATQRFEFAALRPFCEIGPIEVLRTDQCLALRFPARSCAPMAAHHCFMLSSIFFCPLAFPPGPELSYPFFFFSFFFQSGLTKDALSVGHVTLRRCPVPGLPPCRLFPYGTRRSARGLAFPDLVALPFLPVPSTLVLYSFSVSRTFLGVMFPTLPRSPPRQCHV